MLVRGSALRKILKLLNNNFARRNHNHDSTYAASSHNHDSAYAAKNHTHAATTATLKSDQYTYGSLTTNGDGWVTMNPPSGRSYLFVTLVNWHSENGTIAVHGYNRSFYLAGASNYTYTDVVVRFWYCG